MSRKHYIKVAGIIASQYATCLTDEERDKVARIAMSLADMFAQDNERFDQVRFYTACQIDGYPFKSY